MTILLNAHHHGAPRDNRMPGALPHLRALFPQAIEIPAPLAPDQLLYDGVRNLPAIRAHAQAMAERFAVPDPPIYNLGGDCGGELAVIAALNRHYEGRLRVLWFDAHADLNTPASSPSGNFHGMVLRTLTGEGPAALADLVPVPLLPGHIALCGLRDADPAEYEFIARHGIPILRDFDTLDPNQDPNQPLYVHVDYDVLDGAIYPDSVYPTAGGLRLDELIAALQRLRGRHQVRGMSLTEYAPCSDDTAPVRRLLIEGFGLCA